MDPVTPKPGTCFSGQGLRSRAVALTVKKALECLAGDSLSYRSSSDVKDDVVYIIGPNQDSLNIPYLVRHYAGDKERFLVRRHKGLGWEIRRLFCDGEGEDGLEEGRPPV